MPLRKADRTVPLRDLPPAVSRAIMVIIRTDEQAADVGGEPMAILPPRPDKMRIVMWTVCTAAALVFTSGCSAKRVAANAAGKVLAGSTSGLASDDDPALIGDALPFALVMLEQVARSAPENQDVRTTLAAGFTQYAYGWADLKAELVKFEDYDAYLAWRDLARKRYLRGKRWGLEGLELAQPGLSERLPLAPDTAVEAVSRDALPLLYWTGAAWLAAISISADRPDLIAELPQATALLERALALDPDYDRGGLHEIFVKLDMARGAGRGGGKAKAMAHFERALELSEGHRASVFVAYATSIALKEQDRTAFVQYLDKALAIDPGAWPAFRVSNLLAQARARYLLEHVDDLFD